MQQEVLCAVQQDIWQGMHGNSLSDSSTRRSYNVRVVSLTSTTQAVSYLDDFCNKKYLFVSMKMMPFVAATPAAQLG